MVDQTISFVQCFLLAVLYGVVVWGVLRLIAFAYEKYAGVTTSAIALQVIAVIGVTIFAIKMLDCLRLLL